MVRAITSQNKLQTWCNIRRRRSKIQNLLSWRSINNMFENIWRGLGKVCRYVASTFEEYSVGGLISTGCCHMYHIFLYLRACFQYMLLHCVGCNENFILYLNVLVFYVIVLICKMLRCKTTDFSGRCPCKLVTYTLKSFAWIFFRIFSLWFWKR